MKSAMLALLCASFLVAGCSTRAPTLGEIEIDSTSTSTPESALNGGPFCLHIKYKNNWYYYYSENYAEASITDGACASPGSARQIEHIGLGWRYKGESESNKQCASTSICTFSERNYGVAKEINCVAASARDGNWSAHASTDHVACQ
jgi:hypothetical protein